MEIFYVNLKAVNSYKRTAKPVLIDYWFVHWLKRGNTMASWWNDCNDDDAHAM